MKRTFVSLSIILVLLLTVSILNAQSKKEKKDKKKEAVVETKRITTGEQKSTEIKKSPEKSIKGSESAPSVSPESKKTLIASPDKVVGKTLDGKTVYEGVKGGQYTMSDKGAKVYLDADQKKSIIFSSTGADKIVGKTEDGKTIYEGPKGGKYYLNDKGGKMYNKK